MAASPTVSNRIVKLVLAMVAARGGDPAECRRRVGLDEAALADVEGRVPLEQEGRLWTEAARLLGDSDFGLHAAELLQPGAFDVLDYALRASPDLAEALARLGRFNRLLHDVAEIGVRHEGDRACVWHRFRGDPRGAVRHAAEFTVASWVVFGRQSTGQDWAPREVWFQHAQPADVSGLRRFFRAPLRFGQPENAMLLDRGILAIPLLKADPGLCVVLDRHAEDLLRRLSPVAESPLARVRRVVSEELESGEFSAASVARRLKMSPRTLQRVLAEEGTTFRDVVEELRRELALRYLHERSVSISEVAFLLGFSESRAFHRAFKRWTGKTPGEFRAAS
jgi:AraC-like DNA-binding protein